MRKLGRKNAQGKGQIGRTELSSCALFFRAETEVSCCTNSDKQKQRKKEEIKGVKGTKQQQGTRERRTKKKQQKGRTEVGEKQLTELCFHGILKQRNPN